MQLTLNPLFTTAPSILDSALLSFTWALRNYRFQLRLQGSLVEQRTGCLISPPFIKAVPFVSGYLLCYLVTGVTMMDFVSQTWARLWPGPFKICSSWRCCDIVLQISQQCLISPEKKWAPDSFREQTRLRGAQLKAAAQVLDMAGCLVFSEE